MNMHRIIKIAGLTISCLLFSCTKLDETVYSDLLKENFYNSEAEIISALAPAYGGLREIESLWEAASLAPVEEYCSPVNQPSLRLSCLSKDL